MSTWHGTTAEQLAAIAARIKASAVKHNLLGKIEPGDKPIGRPKSPIPKATRDKIAQEKVKAKRRAARALKAVYKESDGERLMAQQLRLAGITDWQREYRFLPDRMFRLDFAWPRVSLAVEIEGGSWSGGRHVRGTGFAKDCIKYNFLALAGWRLLRYTPDMVKAGAAVQDITDMLVGLQMAVSETVKQAKEGTRALQGASQALVRLLKAADAALPPEWGRVR